MKVILKENIEKLGFKDEIVDVKNGFARNFLIPKNKAVIATENAIKVLNELVPNALWILRGWEYSDLEWKDETKTKPTKTEFDAKVKELGA